MSKYLDALAKHQGRRKNDVLKYAETIEDDDLEEVAKEYTGSGNYQHND